MAKEYVCNICGYTYNTEHGDPDNGIIAATDFDNIPDTWACPICGAPKDAFREI